MTPTPGPLLAVTGALFFDVSILFDFDVFFVLCPVFIWFCSISIFESFGFVECISDIVGVCCIINHYF